MPAIPLQEHTLHGLQQNASGNGLPKEERCTGLHHSIARHGGIFSGHHDCWGLVTLLTQPAKDLNPIYTGKVDVQYQDPRPRAA